MRFFAKRRYRRIKRYPTEREKRAVFTAVTTVLLFIIFVILADSRARPLLRSIAENEAKTVVNGAIGDAVAKYYKDANVSYRDLTKIIYDENKNIKSITTNTNTVNQLESRVTDLAVQEIDKRKNIPVKLSVGSIFGGELAAGRGPLLCFNVSFSSNTSSVLENEFESAGINQTKHIIRLRIITEIYISLTGKDISTSVDNTVTLAETVIVGSIPGAYVRN